MKQQFTPLANSTIPATKGNKSKECDKEGIIYILEVWSLSCFNLESSSNFTSRWTTLKTHKRQKNHLGHMTLTAQLKLVNLCWCRKHPSAIYHWSGHIRTVRYISTWLWYTNLTANIIGIAPSPPNIGTRTRYYSTANPAILGQNFLDGPGYERKEAPFPWPSKEH